MVQRRDLVPVGALRIGLPASASLPPFVDWPADLARLAHGATFMISGGHEYDGRPIVPLDEEAVDRAADAVAAAGITSVVITSVFSPLTAECEERAAEIIRARSPNIAVTLSHRLGRIGLLERENAALLNGCLTGMADRTTTAIEEALRGAGIGAPLFLTQNDGTVMHADVARQFPVYCFASGPTNSMRGAAFLSGVDDAIVVDVGGTTTDVGCLRSGFPRPANSVVRIGGVRTLFRMPDLVSFGLGGGTELDLETGTIGPTSVGHRLTERAMVFGGETLTVTDVAVRLGKIALGDPGPVRHLDGDTIERCWARMEGMVADHVDRMKTDAQPIPLIVVGGGAFLVPDTMVGISDVLRVEHAAVANAVGAAIAQVSGEVDQIYTGVDRETALHRAQQEARERARAAGADPASIETVEVEDLPMSYLPGEARRVRVRAVGEIGLDD